MQAEAHYFSRNSIVHDYYTHSEQVREFYSFFPFDPDALETRSKWLDTSGEKRASRDQLASVLQDYNQRIHNSSKAQEHIQALQDERTLVIVGGQQAGLFTGPMMTIYKAITIIREARKAQTQLQRKVVPMFWIAGEDHDIEESNQMYIVSSQGKMEKIKLDLEFTTADGVPVSHIPIANRLWNQALDQLQENLMDTEFREMIISRLQQIHAASGSMSEAFAKTLAWLFADEGLVLLDSADPMLRKLEAPMFERLVEEHAALRECFYLQSHKASQKGYHLQAEQSPNALNLFLIDKGRRKLLHSIDGTYTDKKQELSISHEQLLQIARFEPERLSNNVFTRPLMQEYLLPVLGTVLGPAEIAYWGLLKTGFEYLGLQMPVIIPRNEFTIVEGTIQKHMRKYDLQPQDVFEHFDEKKAAWLKAQDTLDLEKRFSAAKQAFEQIYTPLVESLKQINPGIFKLGQTNQKKIVEQISFLEQRSQEAAVSMHNSSLRQWDKIQLSLYPNGKPQERVYNVFAYLNKYGLEWLEELMDVETEQMKSVHHVLYL